MYLIITDIRIKIQGLNNDGQQCDEYQLNDTNKTDRHDIAEILLKMALNTITLYACSERLLNDMAFQSFD
jgi:hypothetical protein